MNTTQSSILCLYALTPCHAGSGSSVGIVDLPIQRERHSNWPVIHSSGMKGALRAHFDRFKGLIADKPEQAFEQLTEIVFGDDSAGGDHAGSLSVGDVKILAFPMRSNIAPFVWITCPAALQRLNRDLILTGRDEIDLAGLKNLTPDKALWINAACKKDGPILLEDMEVNPDGEFALGEKGAAFFQETDRLLVVHDVVFGYGVSHCTSVMAQIKIDQKTGTTDKDKNKGSLRYQEELPADTLMYTVIFWGDSRDNAASFKAETIRDYIVEDVVRHHIQIGGDETLGRGIFSLTWR